MRILALESNLLWSSRLRLSLTKLGHEAVVVGAMPADLAGFDLAILNLGEAQIETQVAAIKGAEIPILAHAGHKETELHDLGRQLGIEKLATNSELTHKLPQLLAAFAPEG